ncbi:hypothetical protein ACSSV1_003846 [Labrenzia sp. MBR-25]
MPVRLLAWFLLPFAALLSCVGSASAAELTLVSFHYSDAAPVVHLRLEGEIRADDGERVQEAFAQLARCSGTACNNDFGGPRAVVSLASPGGSYSAGVKLADFFRDNTIATVVEAGDTCVSACAMAFLGGSSFWPTGGIGTFIDRTIEPGARVGFHSPYFTEETAVAAVRSGQLGQLLDLTRLAIADIVKNLTRYSVSQHVLDRIISMGPEGFYEIDTPAALFAIRAQLPSFDPALLEIPFEDQILNVCSRLAALHYEQPLSLLDASLLQDTNNGRTPEGDRIRLYDLADRPLNVAGCGVPHDKQTAPLDTMSLYRLVSDGVIFEPLLSFHSSKDGGWSALGYRGGRATDAFIKLGPLNHVLMAPDEKLNDLPPAVTAEIETAKGRIADPALPSHSRPWPAETLFSTPWSRSYLGAGLTIVEQTGPAQLFEELAEQAEGTSILYSQDKPGILVRSGEDTENGTSYYWLALRSGNRTATIRLEAPVLAAGLTDAQKSLMSLVACSTDFEGVHLGCFK